ncbi:hypothetical protein [uncultured Winogradskyella sp.]|uniref:hypothetical protein n=1 Tax=uncultured Winogradskyella sp. TaxID=395353 RepID=UPI0026316E5F|nr:hypothetical protein [uncultured Winogradskyella sp.]
MEFWTHFNNKETLGDNGSEGGRIIIDEEHVNGARITLEEDSYDAPYAITLGIYGVMFHTDFFNTIDEAKSKCLMFKSKIELILQHLSIDDSNREKAWRLVYNELLDDLTK